MTILIIETQNPNTLNSFRGVMKSYSPIFLKNSSVILVTYKLGTLFAHPSIFD